MAANSVNVACLRSHAAGPAKTIVNRRGNVTNEFYAQFHFMRQHQRNKAQGERVSLPGRAIQSSSLCTHCVRVCVCVCRVVPYLLFSSASCCYSATGSSLFSFFLSLLCWPATASGKIQLGVACAAFGASKIIAFCFSTLLCVSVFPFRLLLLASGEVD